MDSQTHRLGFIGAGKLAGSVIRGLMRAKFCPPGDIIASEPNEQTTAALQKETGICLTAENAEVAEKSDVIFIGVKPAMVLPVLSELKVHLGNKLVISLTGGVRISTMEKTGNARFMRALTNTPSTICRAATGVARGSRTTTDDIDLARKIFGAIGVVVEVKEEEIDEVTALSGSGDQTRTRNGERKPINCGGRRLACETDAAEDGCRHRKRLQKSCAHYLDRRFALKPNLKRERALMKQHRQPIRSARAGFERG